MTAGPAWTASGADLRVGDGQIALRPRLGALQGYERALTAYSEKTLPAALAGDVARAAA